MILHMELFWSLAKWFKKERHLEAGGKSLRRTLAKKGVGSGMDMREIQTLSESRKN